MEKLSGLILSRSPDIIHFLESLILYLNSVNGRFISPLTWIFICRRIFSFCKFDTESDARIIHDLISKSSYYKKSLETFFFLFNFTNSFVPILDFKFFFSENLQFNLIKMIGILNVEQNYLQNLEIKTFQNLSASLPENKINLITNFTIKKDKKNRNSFISFMMHKNFTEEADPASFTVVFFDKNDQILAQFGFPLLSEWQTDPSDRNSASHLENSEFSIFHEAPLYQLERKKLKQTPFVIVDSFESVESFGFEINYSQDPAPLDFTIPADFPFFFNLFFKSNPNQILELAHPFPIEKKSMKISHSRNNKQITCSFKKYVPSSSSLPFASWPMQTHTFKWQDLPTSSSNVKFIFQRFNFTNKFEMLAKIFHNATNFSHNKFQFFKEESAKAEITLFVCGIKQSGDYFPTLSTVAVCHNRMQHGKVEQIEELMGVYQQLQARYSNTVTIRCSQGDLVGFSFICCWHSTNLFFSGLHFVSHFDEQQPVGS